MSKFKNGEYILIEKNDQNTDETVDLYVVLTQTNTALARLIKLVTKNKYSHVSLSFNRNCRKMYSFGRKHYYNPLYGVFKNEDITDKIFCHRTDNTMAIYRLMVSCEEAEQIRSNIRRIRDNNNGFNIKGLFAAIINKKITGNKYYCAEFVYEAIHNKTKLEHIKSTLLTRRAFNMF